MEYKFRRFKESDIGSIIELLNTEYSKRKITEYEFTTLICADHNFREENLICVEYDKNIVGVIYGCIRYEPYYWREIDNTGWIVFLVIHNAHKRKGLGTKLVELIEEQLSVTNMSIGNYSPNYFYPGCPHDPVLQSFFDSLGYRSYDKVYSMELDFHKNKDVIKSNYLRSKMSMEELGYSIGKFENNDFHGIKKVITSNFSPSWLYEIEKALFSKSIYENVYVLKDNEMVIGYVQKSINHISDRFGPFGVDSNYRNQGLGSMLFDVMAYKMMISGSERMFFLSTEENGRRFYERKKMKVYNEYIIMKKGDKML